MDRPVLKRRRVFDENYPADQQPLRTSSPDLPDTPGCEPPPSPGRQVQPPAPPSDGTSTMGSSSPSRNPRPPPAPPVVRQKTLPTLGTRPNGPVTVTSNRNKFAKAPAKTQTSLSLGQNTTVTCGGCKLSYRPSNAEDVKVHKKVHAAHQKATVLPSTVRAKLIDCGFNIKAFTVSTNAYGFTPANDRGDKNQKWVFDLVAFVEKEIGAVEGDWVREGAKVFMALDGSRVKGVLVAERVSDRKVYPVVDSTNGACTVDRENEVKTAIAGVSRIWVDKAERRKGTGKALINAVKKRFILGCELSNDEIAFSQPTESGCKLARSFFGCNAGWGVYESI